MHPNTRVTLSKILDRAAYTECDPSRFDLVGKNDADLGTRIAILH